ncbi:MAG: VOC family protein [Parcubacteria group bacterium]|nr:VOC family protein [Parcubacteria group bacterium]
MKPNWILDYEKSKEFYSKILKPLGYVKNMEFGESAGFNDGKNTDFWIGTSKDGVIKSHIAFGAKNKQEVDDFYKTALASGGKDNGAPGYRKEYLPGYYAAFIFDPDGHNVEAVFYDYKEKGDNIG